MKISEYSSSSASTASTPVTIVEFQDNLVLSNDLIMNFSPSQLSVMVQKVTHVQFKL